MNPRSGPPPSAPEVIASGDPRAVKALYTDLGDRLWTAYGGDAAAAPVFSLPETLPVVIPQMDGVTGVILDAGCGPNPTASIALAAHPDRRVISLDFAHGTVRLARIIATAAGVSILGVAGDVERLPFRARAFDGLVCDDTIEHLPDDSTGVAELARVTRSGGRLVLATPNRHNARILRQRLRDRLAGRRMPLQSYFLTDCHIREYTWGEFARLVAGHTTVVGRAGVGWTGGWKSRLATTVARLPAGRRLGAMIVLVAEPLSAP